jgi:GDP-L-fucose synthase
MNRDCKIYLAGHAGLVGSAVHRALTRKGWENVVTRPRQDLDLLRQSAVEEFFRAEKPDCVVLAAARVGGIYANDAFPAEFIYQNLMIQTNAIDAAWRHGARKLVFLGSSCIYPKLAPQPIREEHLLTGPLEPTNEWYAVAKIAGIKLAQAYRKQYGFNAISLMPTNLYGPGDNFDLKTSHVLPALIRRFHEAKVQGAEDVVVWGTGSPRREFMYVDDLADATVFLMEHYDGSDVINVGTGEDITIRELSETIADVVGFEGKIVFDASMPDGTPRKLLDVSRLNSLGWRAPTPLREGIVNTYRWYCDELAGRP